MGADSMRVGVLSLLLASLLVVSITACTPQRDYVTGFDIDAYYEPVGSLVGGALKQQLGGVLRAGYQRYSYSCVWDILEEADADLSDAEQIFLIYRRESVPATARVGSMYDGVTSIWNREHTWARSHGFPREGNYAYTDCHHMRAADAAVNNARSSKDFDEVSGSGGSVAGCSGCRQTDDVFEPPDASKGDVARSMMYMAVRYDYRSAQSDGGTTDLELVNGIVGDGGGVKEQNSLFGKLCTLLAWHERDPPDARERRRNGIVHKYQNNRNPFVDLPELASRVWGPACGVEVCPQGCTCSTTLPVTTATCAGLGWTALPASLATLVNLRQLILRDNQLSSVASGAAGVILERLTMLEVLDLRNNRLTYIPAETLTSLRFLRTVDLRDNRLEALDKELLDTQYDLQALYLTGNPFRCCDVSDANVFLRIQLNLAAPNAQTTRTHLSFSTSDLLSTTCLDAVSNATVLWSQFASSCLAIERFVPPPDVGMPWRWGGGFPGVNGSRISSVTSPQSTATSTPDSGGGGGGGGGGDGSGGDGGEDDGGVDAVVVLVAVLVPLVVISALAITALCYRLHLHKEGRIHPVLGMQRSSFLRGHRSSTESGGEKAGLSREEVQRAVARNAAGEIVPYEQRERSRDQQPLQQPQQQQQLQQQQQQQQQRGSTASVTSFFKTIFARKPRESLSVEGCSTKGRGSVSSLASGSSKAGAMSLDEVRAKVKGHAGARSTATENEATYQRNKREWERQLEVQKRAEKRTKDDADVTSTPVVRVSI